MAGSLGFCCIVSRVSRGIFCVIAVVCSNLGAMDRRVASRVEAPIVRSHLLESVYSHGIGALGSDLRFDCARRRIQHHIDHGVALADRDLMVMVLEPCVNALERGAVIDFVYRLPLDVQRACWLEALCRLIEKKGSVMQLRSCIAAGTTIGFFLTPTELSGCIETCHCVGLEGVAEFLCGVNVPVPLAVSAPVPVPSSSSDSGSGSESVGPTSAGSTPTGRYSPNSMCEFGAGVRRFAEMIMSSPMSDAALGKAALARVQAWEEGRARSRRGVPEVVPSGDSVLSDGGADL